MHFTTITTALLSMTTLVLATPIPPVFPAREPHTVSSHWWQYGPGPVGLPYDLPDRPRPHFRPFPAPVPATSTTLEFAFATGLHIKVLPSANNDTVATSMDKRTHEGDRIAGIDSVVDGKKRAVVAGVDPGIDIKKRAQREHYDPAIAAAIGPLVPVWGRAGASPTAVKEETSPATKEENLLLPLESRPILPVRARGEMQSSPTEVAGVGRLTPVDPETRPGVGRLYRVDPEPRPVFEPLTPVDPDSRPVLKSLTPVDASPSPNDKYEKRSDRTDLFGAWETKATEMDAAVQLSTELGQIHKVAEEAEDLDISGAATAAQAVDWKADATRLPKLAEMAGKVGKEFWG